MTPQIIQWAIRHHVGLDALNELQLMFGIPVSAPPPPVPGKQGIEAEVQAAVRLEAARKGVTLWRNNVGSLKDARGVPVRYGLANDSKRLNQVVKSGDLIGWRTVKITPAHVGTEIAQFVSRECKRPGWQFNPTDSHEMAQFNWIAAITAAGGDAAFCTGEGSL